MHFGCAVGNTKGILSSKKVILHIEYPNLIFLFHIYNLFIDPVVPSYFEHEYRMWVTAEKKTWREFGQGPTINIVNQITNQCVANQITIFTILY